MKLVKGMEDSMNKQLKAAGKKLTRERAVQTVGKVLEMQAEQKTGKPVKPVPAKPVEGPVATMTIRVPGSHKNRVQKWLKAEGITLDGKRQMEKGMALYVVNTGRAIEDIKEGITAKWKIHVVISPGVVAPTVKEAPKSAVTKADVSADGPRGEVSHHQQSGSAGATHSRPAKSGNRVAVMQAGPRRSGPRHK